MSDGDNTTRTQSAINQLDRIVSAQILGAIIFGKFSGDLIERYLIDVFGGTNAALVGMVLGLWFMIFWPSIEQTYRKWQEDIWSD